MDPRAVALGTDSDERVFPLLRPRSTPLDRPGRRRPLLQRIRASVRPETRCPGRHRLRVRVGPRLVRVPGGREYAAHAIPLTGRGLACVSDAVLARTAA